MAGLKKILIPFALLVGGSGVGAAAAFATASLLGPAQKASAEGPKQETEKAVTTFVPVDDVLAPLVLPDGQRLAGYVSFQIALEVAEDQADSVTARLPVLRHEINMRTYRQPMASGPDGTLPSLETFRTIVLQAAEAAFGKGTIRSVAISGATPA